VPLATAAPEPFGTPVKAVPRGSTSTSSRTTSLGFGSVTVPLNTAERLRPLPPTGMAVTPSFWNCPSAVGASGGSGMTVAKSAAVSAFPPNDTHALARPVWSRVRARQWYDVLSASPVSVTVGR